MRDVSVTSLPRSGAAGVPTYLTQSALLPLCLQDAPQTPLRPTFDLAWAPPPPPPPPPQSLLEELGLESGRLLTGSKEGVQRWLHGRRCVLPVLPQQVSMHHDTAAS